MVAVDSPYLSFQKAHPKNAETRRRVSRPGGALREPRFEQESLPTVSNLCSWNGYLLIYRLGSSSLRSPLAFALRNSAAISSTSCSHGRSALSLPQACTAPSKTVFCQLRSGAPSNPSLFQRYPCSHYGRLRVVQPSGALPSSGSCAPRPEHLKYIAQSASVQALPAVSPGAPTRSTFTP